MLQRALRSLRKQSSVGVAEENDEIEEEAAVAVDEIEEEAVVVVDEETGKEKKMDLRGNEIVEGEEEKNQRLSWRTWKRQKRGEGS